MIKFIANSIFISLRVKKPQACFNGPLLLEKRWYHKGLEKTRVKVDHTHRVIKSKLEGIKENIFTYPNGLSLLRIISTPFIGYFVLQQYYLQSLIIFVFAGLTDLVFNIIIWDLYFNLFYLILSLMVILQGDLKLKGQVLALFWIHLQINY